MRHKRGDRIRVVLESFPRDGDVLSSEIAAGVLDRLDRAWLRRKGALVRDGMRRRRGYVSRRTDIVVDDEWRGAMAVTTQTLGQHLRVEPPHLWERVDRGVWRLTPRGIAERDRQSA